MLTLDAKAQKIIQAAESAAKESLLAGELIHFVDYTRLHENDTEAALIEFSQEAITQEIAAVCVYPQYAALARSLLIEKTLPIATVANFPHGNSPIENVIAEIELSLNAGAKEIDLVFPYHLVREGERQQALSFLKTARRYSEGALLKIILETGLIEEVDMLATFADMAIDTGADFLKTSTGKVNVGATLAAAYYLLESTIRAGASDVGIKISGGIRSLEQALPYYYLADIMKGSSWMNPRHFRFGLSRLFPV